MGFFDKVNEKLDEQRKKELETILLEGEEVKTSYQLVEDFCTITTKRLIFVDKQWTTTKKGVHSIPFSKITAVSLTRGGAFSFTKEVEIIVGSKNFELKFISEAKAAEFYRDILKIIL